MYSGLNKEALFSAVWSNNDRFSKKDSTLSEFLIFSVLLSMKKHYATIFIDTGQDE